MVVPGVQARRVLAAAALVAAMAILPGCMTVTTYCLRPNLTAHAVGAEAPVEAGAGDVPMAIRLREAGTGIPLPGAPVRAYWPVEPKGGGDSTSYVPLFGTDVTRNEPASAAALMYIDLRTAPDGTAILHAPAGAQVTAVALAEGHTMESGRGTAEPGTPGIGVALHRSSLEVARNETWSAIDVRAAYLGAGDDVAWFPVPLPWDADAGVNRNYTMRMVELHLALDWSNAPTARSDMGIGFGLEPTEMLLYRNDHDEVPSLAAGHEEATLVLQDFEEIGTVGKHTLHAGAAYEAMVAPAGMSTNLTLRGRFDTELLANKYCVPEYSGVSRIVDASGQEAPRDVQAPPAGPASHPAKATAAPRETSAPTATARPTTSQAAPPQAAREPEPEPEPAAPLRTAPAFGVAPMLAAVGLAMLGRRLV